MLFHAPFDQRFYLILNLAAGGTFDSGYVPDSSFTSGTMLVDYVRVYQRMVNAGEDEKADKNEGVSTNGAKDGLYGEFQPERPCQHGPDRHRHLCQMSHLP